MNNNITVENLKVASKSQNLAIINLSFLEILYRKKILEDNNGNIEKIIESLGSQNRNIINVKNKLIDSIEKIHFIYEEQELNKNSSIGYFKNLREDIHSILIDLSRYLTEISYYNNIYFDIISRETFDGDIRIDFQEFYKKVYSFLMEDEALLNQKISEIVWSIPIKISKKKYYSILEGSFRNSFKNSSKEKVDILFKRFKSIFNGTMEWGYVDSYDKYFRVSQYYKDSNYKNIELEELEKLYIESTDVIKELELLLDYVRELGMIANKLIIITLLKDSFNVGEIEDIIRYIEKIKQYSKNELFEKIGLREKELISETKKYQTITKDILNKGITIENDSINMYKTTEKVIGYLKDYYIERDELIFSEGNCVDESYLVKSIENFIQFIDRNIKTMDNRNRKIRMKKILSLIDTPFRTPDEFFDYFKSSIEFNNDKEEIKYIMNEVYAIISRYEKRP